MKLWNCWRKYKPKERRRLFILRITQNCFNIAIINCGFTIKKSHSRKWRNSEIENYVRRRRKQLTSISCSLPRARAQHIKVLSTGLGQHYRRMPLVPLWTISGIVMSITRLYPNDEHVRRMPLVQNYGRISYGLRVPNPRFPMPIYVPKTGFPARVNEMKSGIWNSVRTWATLSSFWWTLVIVQIQCNKLSDHVRWS